MGKKQVSGSTGSNASTTENALMLNEHSAPKSNTSTPTNEPGRGTTPKTVMIGDQEFTVVETVETQGKDVPKSTYDVVMLNNIRKAVVNGELRSFSAFGGTIRAKQKPSEHRASKAENSDLPPNTVQVSPKVMAVLRAVSAITGEELGDVLANAVDQIAASNDVPPALLARIISRWDAPTNPG